MEQQQKYQITPEGRDYYNQIKDVNYDMNRLLLGYINAEEDIETMRYKYVLQQYIEGRTSPMNGIVLYPYFVALVNQGYLEEVY